MFTSFLPPEAPEDEKPMPIDERPIHRLIPSRMTHKLIEAGIITIGDLRRAMTKGPLTRFKGVGPGTQKAVEDAFEAERRMHL